MRKTLQLSLAMSVVIVTIILPPAMAGSQTGTGIVLRVGMELTDGSYLLGVPSVSNIAVKTSYADLQMNLDCVSRVNVSPNDRTASVEMRNGDRIKGTLETSEMRIESLIGNVLIRREQILRLSVLRGGAQDVISTVGLLLRYTFDVDGGSNAMDETPNRFDGAERGVTWTDAGVQGGAIVFSTANDYVDCPVTTQLPLEPGDDCSFSFWWRTDRLNDWSCFVSKSDAGDSSRGLYFMYYSPRSCYYLHLKGDHCADFGVSVTPQSWNHVVLVKSGTTWKVYHNGKEIGITRSVGWPFLESASKNVSIWWGRDRCIADNSFRGEMDDLRVYKRALTESEVRQLHNSQK
jgi:hypothetical protein